MHGTKSTSLPELHSMHTFGPRALCRLEKKSSLMNISRSTHLPEPLCGGSIDSLHVFFLGPSMCPQAHGSRPCSPIYTLSLFHVLRCNFCQVGSSSVRHRRIRIRSLLSLLLRLRDCELVNDHVTQVLQVAESLFQNRVHAHVVYNQSALCPSIFLLSTPQRLEYRTVCLYAQVQLRLARMRDAVAAELDVRVLHYHVAQCVSERVVFVVELEGGGVLGGTSEL